jgi:hypothetical protein
MRKRFSSYTGYSLSMKKAAEYINDHPELINKKITGDINGMNAYLDNP